MRLIDADELRDRVGYIEYEYGHINEEIDKMPTIEAEPIRHGKWIESEKSDFNWECSECGYGLTDNKLTYCYDCGAKMDLDEVNNEGN